MTQPQKFEGTVEEFMDRKEEFVGMRLQVFAIPSEETIGQKEEEKAWSALLPDPPNTVQDCAHLEALLLEGINSPQHPVTEETWEEIRREVRRRHAKIEINKLKKETPKHSASSLMSSNDILLIR